MTDTGAKVQRPQIDPDYRPFGQTFQQVPAELQRQNTKANRKQKRHQQIKPEQGAGAGLK